MEKATKAPMRGYSSPSQMTARREGDGKQAEWHRWTAAQGFASSGWHHVAVAYVFGKPKSLRENGLYSLLGLGQDTLNEAGDPKPAVVYLPKWEDIQTCIITC